jgi:acetylornithine deacetylase
MKGFVACCLAAVPDFVAMRVARPLHLFISYDEETDCAGARRLVADMTESGLRPELCIVGEPSGMQPIVAHKGRLAARVAVRGKPGHSSRPAHGVNAVTAAAEAIVWLAAEARRTANEGPFEDGFDPPHTTIHVGRIEGGTALNIIPEHAEFFVEWRTIPGDDAQTRLDGFAAHLATAIEPAMRRVDPACGFVVSVLDALPGLSLPPAHPLAALVRRLTGARASGKVSYGTEAGLYQQAGIAAIVCGPGDIAQAHQPDEWIAETELARCDAFLRGIARHLAA